MKTALSFFIILLAIILWGCSEQSVSPSPGITNGVEGHVLDSTGNPVKDVKIYCLFSIGYIPDTTGGTIHSDKTLADSVFKDTLYQNFPNPFSKDTYFRLSVSGKSVVDLKVFSKRDGYVAYVFYDTVYSGLYQRYLHIGTDPDVRNGIYSYRLKITPLEPDTLKPVEFQKEMLLINNKNKPSAISNNQGFYSFDYAEALIGDTIKTCSYHSPGIIHKNVLTENISFLFMREGYITKQVFMTLYNNVLFTQDVILEREN